MKDALDRIVMAALDGFTVLGALIAAWLLFEAVRAENAIGTAATAAVALGCIAVPYSLSAMYHRILTRECWRRRG